jgi:hypothetical protein
MRTLVGIIIICGACFVLLMALLSVLRDLLTITTRHDHLELDSHAVGREEDSQ